MNEFELSVHLASNIRDAKLVPLDSANHIVLEHEPAWAVFVNEVTAFMEEDRVVVPRTDMLDELSPRELEVLRLAADGLDNEAIAGSLILSLRTVERHLQNVYVKFGLQGKSARAAAVARLLTSA